MRKTIVLVFLISFLSPAHDFNTLLNLAFKNNRELRSANNEIESSKYNLKSARSLYLPEIEAEMFKVVYQNEPLVIFPLNPASHQFVTFPITDDNFTQFNLTMNWLLFDFGGRKSAYKTAKKGVIASKYNLSLKKREIAIALIERYEQAIELKESIEIINHTIEDIDRHLLQVKKFRKEGLVPKSDILRLEAMKLNLESKRADLKGKLDIVLKEIERITLTSVDSRTLSPLPDIEIDRKNAGNQALNNREEIKLITINKQVNTLQAKIERSLSLPQLVARVEYSNTTNNLNPVKSNTIYYVGIKLKLFDGMKSHYKKKSYLSLAKKSENILENTKKRISIQIQNELKKLESLEKQVKFREQAYQASKENYRVVELQFKEHIVSSIDLKDALTSLQRDETQLKVTREKLKAQKLKILWLTRKVEGE